MLLTLNPDLLGKGLSGREGMIHNLKERTPVFVFGEVRQHEFPVKLVTLCKRWFNKLYFTAQAEEKNLATGADSEIVKC